MSPSPTSQSPPSRPGDQRDNKTNANLCHATAEGCAAGAILAVANAGQRFPLEEQLVRQIAEARARGFDDARPGVVEGAHQRGRLTARERLTALFDAASFIEYGALAGATTQPDDEAYADGLVGGVGLVHGQPVAGASYDESVHGGTQSDRNQRKMAKLLYLAVAHRWPLVCFVDGGGARLDDPAPPPPIAVTPRGRFEIYDGLAELNGWAPTVAIASGRSVDGHVGIAMLSDLVIATEAAQFGTREGHFRGAGDYAKTGDVDALVDSETEAIEVARRYLHLYLVDQEAGEAADAASIADHIPENRRRPYDMRRVVAAFADRDSVLELGASWGRSMLTAIARLDGRTVGIFANQPKSPLAGAIDADAADKASRFVELCDAYDYPLVSFVDNPGYMVGPQAEREGIARHHAAAARGAAPSHGAALFGADPQGVRPRPLRHVRLGRRPAGAGDATGVAVGGVRRHVARRRRVPRQAQGDPRRGHSPGSDGDPRRLCRTHARCGLGTPGRAKLPVRRHR